MRAKTIIYYKPNGEVDKILSNAGPTRHIKAGNLLLQNKVKPTLGMRILGFFRWPRRAKHCRKKKFAKKLHNFFVNVKKEIEYHADNIAVNPIVGSQAAADGAYTQYEFFSEGNKGLTLNESKNN